MPVPKLVKLRLVMLHAISSKWIVNKMKLVHKKHNGIFYNNKNIATSFATSVFSESFPSALLIDKQQLITLLKENDCEIFWTLLGEKQFIGGSLLGREFKGRQEMTGLYKISSDGSVVGSMKRNFESPK